MLNPIRDPQSQLGFHNNFLTQENLLLLPHIPQQPARSQDLISNIKFDIKNNYTDE